MSKLGLFFLLVALAACASAQQGQTQHACKADADCSGQNPLNKCRKSVCVQACKTDGECGAGAECEHEEEAKDGTDGFCKLLGKACTKNSDCAQGEECEHGFCEADD